MQLRLLPVVAVLGAPIQPAHAQVRPDAPVQPTLQVGPFYSPDRSMTELAMRLTYGVDSLLRDRPSIRIIGTTFGEPRRLEPLDDPAADYAIRAEMVRIHPDTLHVRWLLTRGRNDVLIEGREVRTTNELSEIASSVAAAVRARFDGR